jgi:hypothetical protein
MERFRIERFNHPMDLCRADHSATPPKPYRVYLTLDTRSGQLGTHFRASVETGVPFAVNNGHIRWYPLSWATDAVELSASINAGEFDPLFRRIFEGAEVRWDGSNSITTLLRDAKRAEEELEERLQLLEINDGVGGLWDAADWLLHPDHTAAGYGITANTRGDELVAIADRVEADARSEMVILYGTRQRLEEVVEYLQDRIHDVEDRG